MAFGSTDYEVCGLPTIVTYHKALDSFVFRDCLRGGVASYEFNVSSCTRWAIAAMVSSFYGHASTSCFCVGLSIVSVVGMTHGRAGGRATPHVCMDSPSCNSHQC